MKALKHKIITIILSTLILCSSMPVFAADLLPDLSEEQLERTIDAYVEKHKNTTAAVSIGVFTKDSILFEESYGYANIEDQVLNNAETVIEWGSSAKLFTWVSVMQLAEQGKLDLNADIHNYLPDKFLTKLKYDDKITLTHLMNHTGGWQECYIELLVDSPDKIRSLEDSLKVLEPAQIYRPGETVAYSNFGAALAGYIVELVSGEPFYEYVNNNIFTPLGMTHTSIKPDRSDNPWVQSERQKLSCYDVENKPIGKADYYITCYPAGGTVGTISDYITFGQALLSDSNGGTVLFNKPETLAEFYMPTNNYLDGTPRNLHGMYTIPFLTGKVAGHAGNSDGCSSNLLIDLDRGFGVVVMTNQKNEYIYNMGLMEEIFGTVETRAGENLPDPAYVTGTYRLARSYKTGISKIMRILGLHYFNVSQNDDGSTNISLLGQSRRFDQVYSGVFLVSSGGKSTLWYAGDNIDGKVQAINAETCDYLRVNYVEYVLDVLSIGLLIVAAIYSVVYLIIALIRLFRKRKSPLNVLRLILCGSILFTILNLVIYISSISAYASTPFSIMINGIFFLLLGLVPVAYTIILTIKWKWIDLTKIQKAGLITNGVMGLILTFNILYWQLWMFWV